MTKDFVSQKRTPAFEAERDLRLHPVAAKASELLVRWREPLLTAAGLGPVLDVACGDGRNGLHLASYGAQAELVDVSLAGLEALGDVGAWPNVRFMKMDLEGPVLPDFEREHYGVVLVFRYLYRPLLPVLRNCLVPGGLFMYETYLEGQEIYGKPRKPEHLLKRGELLDWFRGWEVLEHYEGRLDGPPRFMGRIVCRKPSTVASRSRP